MSVEPLPSATVVLIRDGEGALELLLLERRANPDGRRPPWVFPGGKIEAADRIGRPEGDVITMTDIFVYEQTGFESGRVVGRLRPTGLRPRFIDKIEASGIHLPATIFGVGGKRGY